VQGCPCSDEHGVLRCREQSIGGFQKRSIDHDDEFFFWNDTNLLAVDALRGVPICAAPHQKSSSRLPPGD